MDLMLAFSPEASEGSGRSAPVVIGKLKAVRCTTQGRGSGCPGTERCHVNVKGVFFPNSSRKLVSHYRDVSVGELNAIPTHTHTRTTQPGPIESGPVSVSTFYKLLR